MVRHLVFWKLKAEAEGRSAEENAALLAEQAQSLMGRVPGLLSMEVSAAMVSSTAPADVALMSTHESVEAYEAYAVHPLHLPILEFVGKVAETRQAYNYEV